jgi:malate dehydrogenase (oxaloacetate-decarboxylating)
VALAIKTGLMRAGLSEPQARERVLVLDSKGLLVEGRKMESYKEELAQRKEFVAAWGVDGSSDNLDLLATLQHSKATALLGLSGQPGTFQKEHIEAMLHEERPVVFALSNPTSICEANPADVIAWTDGKAMVATGSPFPAVEHGGKSIPIGQGNNAFIFPGLGFGSVLADAKEITDGMVLEAAYALAEYVADKHGDSLALYPPVDELRAVSLEVAARVSKRCDLCCPLSRS